MTETEQDSAGGSNQPDSRPMASIGEVWAQYREWAATARNLKVVQDKTRLWTLALGLSGAALGTATGIDGLEAQCAYLPESLALLSAAAVALAGYIGRELLTPDRESEFTRSRLLAEALKREVWRALLRVPPYDGVGASHTLIERTAKFLENTGLKKLHTDPTDSDDLPEARSPEQYILLRIDDQIEWYERTAAKQQKKLSHYQTATLILGATAVMLGLGGVSTTGLSMWIPVVTTASVAVVALLRANRIQDLIPLYQETAVQLRLHRALWQDGVRSREQAAREGRSQEVQQASWRFVEICEGIMSRENESWRAEWAKEEESTDALRQAYEAARGPSSRKDGPPTAG